MNKLRMDILTALAAMLPLYEFIVQTTRGAKIRVVLQKDFSIAELLTPQGKKLGNVQLPYSERKYRSVRVNPLVISRIVKDTFAAVTAYLLQSGYTQKELESQENGYKFAVPDAAKEEIARLYNNLHEHFRADFFAGDIPLRIIGHKYNYGSPPRITVGVQKYNGCRVFELENSLFTEAKINRNLSYLEQETGQVITPDNVQKIIPAYIAKKMATAEDGRKAEETRNNNIKNGAVYFVTTARPNGDFGGMYMLGHHLPDDTFRIIRQHGNYMSKEDLDDYDMFHQEAGWRFSYSAVAALKNAKRRVFIDNKEITS